MLGRGVSKGLLREAEEGEGADFGEDLEESPSRAGLLVDLDLVGILAHRDLCIELVSTLFVCVEEGRRED